MKKLVDIFKPEDPEVQADIIRIDNLIYSEKFLQGIGVYAIELKKSTEFPIVEDYLKAAEMLLSQSMYSLPEPWPYQCFMEVWEEENGRIKYGASLSNDRRIEIREHLEKVSKVYGDLSTNILNIIKLQYQRHDIKKFLLSKGASTEKVEDWINESPVHIICNNFPNEIEGLISSLVEASFYSGLSKSPFYLRIIEAFETGGIPAGWVGSTPENGGRPNDCLQLLHYGI